jgi:hypothetical protein
MAEPKLILVEGIPGSGKTTAARFVSDWLEKHGKQPALFLEGDWNHPADYESVACLDETEYTELQARFPEFVTFLAENARNENGEWLFSYRRMQHEYSELAPGELFEALARFEIYDLPADKHQRLMRQNWQDFATRAATESLVYVFECCFLQNPLTTLLARHNLSKESVCEHVSALAEIIKPLRPSLIYLAQSDVRATLEKVQAERPQEWADYVTWYLTSGDYGKTRGLNGFDGVIEFYATRQALELDLLKTLPILSTIISDRTDWIARYDVLTFFLEKEFAC